VILEPVIRQFAKPSFAKLEAARSGLMPGFIAAMDANVPILTSVVPQFEDERRPTFR
jgi:Protein of unknown function (DUF2478)